MWIPFEEIEIKEKIGTGSFSKVYRGTWLNTDVAIKEYNFPTDQELEESDSFIVSEGVNKTPIKELSLKRQYSSPFQKAEEEKQAQNLLKSFLNELSVLVKLRHPNIVLFLGISKHKSKIYVITQLMKYGSMSEVLHNTRKHPLSAQLLIRLALDIARAVYFLHRQSPAILHRDLKSENILITENYEAKLCDFGTAKLKRSNCTHETNTLGTIQWMAPEFVANKLFTQKSDVYSYGILLWEILTRRQPFEELHGIQIAYGVVNTELRPSFEKFVAEESPLREHSGKLKELIESCWSQDPTQRPIFSEIIERLLALAE